MIFLYMVPAVILSAGAIIAMKFALVSSLPLEIAFYRFSIAAVTTLLFAKIYKVKLFHVKRRDLVKVLSSGMLLWLYNILLVVALKHTSAIKVSVLSSLIPLVTFLIGSYIYKKSISIKDSIAIIIALIGTVLLINPRISSFNIGDMYVLIAVFCFSIYSIINKSLNKYHALNMMFIYFLIATLMSWPFVGFQSIKELQLHSSLIAIIYLGIFGSGFAYLLIQKSIQSYGPSKTTIFLNLVPVVAIILSVIILDEVISLYSVFFILVILSGVVLKCLNLDNIFKLDKGKIKFKKQ